MLRNRMKHLLLAAFILLAVVVLLPPSVSGHMPLKPTVGHDVTKHFTVVVSRNGFNGTSEPFVLNLVEGEMVHITFLYGDDDLSYDNPHVIFLVGYDLRTSLISKSNPTATMEFMATRTGAFAFYCVIPCQGMMNLESGVIEVAPRPAGTMPTSVEITVQETAVQGQAVTIQATLMQGSQPVPNVHVDFYLNTTFGPMKIGTGETDHKGVARIGYKFFSSGQVTVKVQFAGSWSLAASSNQLNLDVEPRREGPVHVSILPGFSGESISSLPFVRGQNRMPDLRLVGVPFSQGVPVITVIFLIVGSVWATYAYVFAQLRAIVRGSSSEQMEEKGESERKLESIPTKRRLDKRFLIGVLLVVVVVAGFFAYYQFGATPEKKTVALKIEIKMIMQNEEERHVFDPVTISAKRGDHVILMVTNLDEDAIHGIAIPELNLNTGPLGGNQQTKIEFDADTIGTFTILCPVPGCAPDHAQMIAQLVVTG